MKTFFAIVLAGLMLSGVCAAAAKDYAVVVSAQTAAAPGWSAVVQALAAKHHGTTLIYTNSITEVLPALQKQFPRYACFVTPPAEAGRKFVAQVHQLTRRLDDDPYTDCFWGILTGYDATNALAIVKQAKPLTIRKVAGGTALAMDMVEEGVTFDEGVKGRSIRKEKGGKAHEVKVPDDSTASIVSVLNDERPDLFVTSGHATERDWMIGYSYRNGLFRHENGQLFGEDMAKKKFPVASPNPKVYLPVGNCLMGHIDGADCMATAWMNSAGVCQMLGYTVPTWYGYGGWGVMDYFMEQPGRYTLTEAFFANQHALIHRLNSNFTVTPVEGSPGKLRVALNAAAQAAGLTAKDGSGLLYDRDTVAFYGDPAWAARMVDRPKAFEQKLTEKKGTFTFEIKPNRGAASFGTISGNGSARGGRPIIAFLPHRVRDVKVTEGAELNPVITDDFILVPHPGVCDPAKEYRVRFTASPIR